MQKLLREYMDELNKRQKKNRKIGIAVLVLVVVVFGSVMGILTQYGVAMTGKPICGLEEHTHTEECYEKTLVCGLEEGEGHTHTEECLYPAELTCGLEEDESHTHTDDCYTVPDGYACGLEESEGHTHTEECYEEILVCGKEEHIHTDACYMDVEAEDAEAEDAATEDNEDAEAEDHQDAEAEDHQDAATEDNEDAEAEAHQDAATEDNEDAATEDAAIEDDQDSEAEELAEETAFAEQLSYEDEKVTVTVAAAEAGIIPEDAALQVIPIEADNADTAEQYKDVESRLQEKAAEEEYDIAGFLAYDISFVDQDGNEIEPNGEVKVIMDYKEAALPDELKQEETGNLDVTVIHLEENEQGEVEKVTDLSQVETEDGEEPETKIEILKTTEAQEVEKAVFETDSFSTYSLTWISSAMYGMDDQVVAKANNDQYTGTTTTTIDAEVNKTAKVLNEEKRLFRIDLSATSTSFQTTESSNIPIDVVLVLDVSGSMNNLDVFSGETNYDGLDKASTYYLYENGKYYQVKYDNSQLGKWIYYDCDIGSAGAGTSVAPPTITPITTTPYELSSMENYKSIKYYSSITARIEALKQSVNKFVDALCENSPKSSVAIVTFSSKGSARTVIGLTKVGEGGAGQLKDKIQGLCAVGDTYPAQAIQNAHELLLGSTNETHMIVLGDGGCGTSRGPDLEEEDNAIKNAAAAIEDDVTIHAIRFVSEDATYLNGIISEGETVYEASDASSLVDSFNLIIEASKTALPIESATVSDTIDPRFVVTNKDGQPLADGERDGYTLKTDDGIQHITWSNQNINPKGENSASGWSKVIYVKAKEDFFGGNAVPTNVGATLSDSEGTTIKEFPKPSVNVQLLELQLTGSQKTVYKGDNIESSGFASILAGTLNVKGLTDNTILTDVLPKNENNQVIFPELTVEQKTVLKEKGEITVGEDQKYKYAYLNADDPVGYFKYTYAIEGGDAENHKVTASGEEYTLTVEFVPYSVADRRSISTTHIEPADNGGTEQTLSRASADYVVNVISGEIRITKKLDPSAVDNSKSQKFEFVVTGSEESEGFKKTINITIAAGEDEGTYDGNALEGLARGSYTVSESPSPGFEILGTPTLDANCYASVSEYDTVTFKMGYKNNGNDSIVDVIKENSYENNGTLGRVVFTNEKVYSTWAIQKVSASGKYPLEGAKFKISQLDGNQNYTGSSDKNGIVEWTNATGNVNYPKLPSGTYTLRETKSPVGFSLSEDVWTVEVAKNGALKSIKKNDVPITPVEKTITVKNEDETEGETTITCFCFENEMMYELPSAGGTGIFWYLISGMLLMSAGALFLYKNKRKEVQGS